MQYPCRIRKPSLMMFIVLAMRREDKVGKDPYSNAHPSWYTMQTSAYCWLLALSPKMSSNVVSIVAAL
jgi:hypothetical protein